MRIIMVVFGVFFSLNLILGAALADHPSRVTVNIDDKTYFCSGDGSGGVPDCNSKASALRQRLEFCDSDESASYCAKQLWPEFKLKNPNCIDEGSVVCIEICDRDESASFCAKTICR